MTKEPCPCGVHAAVSGIATGLLISGISILAIIGIITIIEAVFG